MTRPHDHWKILPHGPLTAIDDDMLTAVGWLRMPLMNLPRRMTVVRLRDSRLVVWSAIALDATQMAKLESFGRPAFLVVPNDHHRLDAKAWKARYAEMQVIAPPGAREHVEQVVSVDSTSPDFGDPRVRFTTVPGTREREAALVVQTSSGTTRVLNDLVGNIRASGVNGALLRLAGFAGEAARIPRVVKLALVKDAVALCDQLSQWAQIPTLKRILVSHGDPIEDDPRGTLRELAASLS